MKVEIHLLQNFAPSCLNRDDTGSPKQSEFGGTTRARISSQCFKRTIRDTDPFKRLLAEKGGSVRTRLLIYKIAQIVSGRAENQPPKPDVEKEVAKVFEEAGLERSKQKKGEDGAEEERDVTKVILYMDHSAIKQMADAFTQNWDALKAGDKEKRSETIESLANLLADAVQTPDIALFGRMIEVNSKTPIGQKQLRVDAALYPSHPISTHSVDYDTDFFTAVDDISGETGASMMGHAGYNSACYYRYACVDFDQLVDNLKDDRALAERTLEAFLESFCVAIPHAKQTSMATFEPPDFGLLVVRNAGVPLSMANAFARPVDPWEGREYPDLVGNSVSRLVMRWERTAKVYGTRGVVTAALFHMGYEGDRLGRLAACDVETLEEAVARVMRGVRDQLTDKDQLAVRQPEAEAV